MVGQDPQTGWWVGTVDHQKYGLVPINFLDVTAERLRALSMRGETGLLHKAHAGDGPSGETALSSSSGGSETGGSLESPAVVVSPVAVTVTPAAGAEAAAAQ